MNINGNPILVPNQYNPTHVELTGTPTAPTAAAGTNSSQIATTAFVMNAFAANDAMIFKGTLGTNGTITSLPDIHEAGWTYKVITANNYAGQSCEIGDMVICVADGNSANNADWAVVQTNVDGAVVGPVSSSADHVVTFTGTTGKVIKDSGFTIAKSVPADAKFTDTTYENKTAASGGTEISLVTTGDKYTWNNKGTYSKPATGIPDTDLATDVQESLDKANNAVIGPSSSTAEHIATFTGTTGKAIKDSGFTIATSVPANAVFTDTTVEVVRLI